MAKSKEVLDQLTDTLGALRDLQLLVEDDFLSGMVYSAMVVLDEAFVYASEDE